MGRTKEIKKQFLTKVSGIVAVVALAFCMFIGISLQAEAATAKVTASSARVRKTASTSSDVVGSVANGESFTIQEEVTGSDGYTWYKISLNGATGYIRSDLAQKSESGSTGTGTTTNTEVTEIQPISAKVTGAQVRVRPDASTNGSVVTTVAKDEVVTVNGTAAGADGKTWYSVSFRSGNNDVTGFIREDFLELAGEIVPVTEETPEVPPAVEPVPEVPEIVVEVKDYDTLEEDDVWYLVNNTTSPAYKYVIEDIFSAAKTNADLYEGSLKTIRNQKIFIVILVLLIVAGGIGATLVIFKMKDMLDESYFEEVEKEVAAKRQNKPQNVMHTVGKDSVQKKPTVNGQPKPAAKPQTVNGQPRPATAASARPTVNAQNPGAQPKQPTAAAQAAPQKTTQASPASPAQRPVAAAKPAGGPVAAKPAAKPQGNAVQKPANTAKPNQEWKSKNFMSDDEDDFEYDFLNWDGDEEM